MLIVYAVKEIFYTLQGEGSRTGWPAVFCRFAGCNLWSGREKDRRHAVCQFCDTDFVGVDGPGGGRFGRAEDLARAVADCWRGETHPASRPYVVCTGGEPLLQLDAAAVAAIHGQGLEVAIETNGTRPAPPGIDWVCVSPKAGTELVLTSGDDLKLVFPQPGAEPHRYEGLDFANFLLQPLDGPGRDAHTRAAVEYCLANPQWRLSMQTHKYLGIR